MSPKEAEAKRDSVLPEAQILSITPGRLRLKITGAHVKSSGLEQLAQRLSTWEGIKRVEASPLTGSILIFHDKRTDSLWQKGIEHRLFVPRLKQEAPQPKKNMNRHIRIEKTNTDLSGFIGATLLGLAALQATRGKFLPAGLTLIFQASEFLKVWGKGSPSLHLEPLSEGL